MRLDFRNVGQGLTAIADAKKARDLAREAERYNVAEQAGMSPEQIERAQAETMGLAQQDAQEFGLDVPQQFRVQDAQPVAPSFRVGGQDFATREEAIRAARPMRAEGLARVRERFGDVEEAEALRERADTARFRDIQMRGLERTDRQAETVEAVDSDMSNWMTERLTGDDGTMRAPTTEDTIAAIQHRAALFQQKGLGDQAAAALQQFTAIAANQIQLQTAERNQALSTVAAGIASGDFASVQDFYDRYIPDGAKVTNIKEGRDGRITISRTTLDNEKLPATTFANRNEMLAALNSVRDPMSLYNYSQQEFKNNIAEQELALKGDERSRKQREADAKPSVAAQRIYDVLKNTDSFKRAVERGETAAQRQLLANSGIPTSELYKFGVEEPPVGGGGSTGRGPFYEPDDQPPPAAPAAQTPGLSRGPSPALQEQMRRMPITRFTGIGTLEQAARFGNEAAIRELERRDASAMQLGARPPLLGDMGLQ